MVRHSELLPDERILPLSLAVKAMIGVESLRTRPSGMVSFDNADGTKTIIGGSGTDQIATNAGDTQAPSRPTGLSATSTMQAALVHWDGTLEYGMVDDFDHIEIFAQPDGGDVLDIGCMRTAGELATGRLPVGSVVELWAVAADNAHDLQGNPSPNMSDESDHLVVTIDEPVDQNQIRETAEKLQKAADDAAAKADDAIRQGEQIRQDAQAGIDDARKQAQDAAAKADKARSDLQAEVEANRKATDTAIAAVDVKADKVRTDLTQQMQDAKSEMDSTVKAAQSSADKAQSAADAAQKAADKANASTADLDKTVQAVDAKAVAAKQAAAEAQSKAENVASDLDSANAVIERHTTELGELTTKVTNAVKKSDRALSVSTEARQTATEASTTATSAYKDSQTALTQSTTASQTATTAKTTAESASKTAGDSLKQSSSAVQTANQISTTLRTEYQTKADADKIYATQSSLKQTSDSITASVSKTYATKDALTALQNVADNAIESWRGTGVPTLTNKPASDWTTDAEKKKHSGDLYYDKATGKAYRFGSDDGKTYTWELNQDSDVTKALSDASKAQTSANNAQTSANAANTAAGKAQTTANTAVSNAATAKNAADAAQSSANKAQGDVDKLKVDIPATYATKSSLTQTAESITANVESVKSTANSAVTAASKAQQTADGISANLSKNYQTKSQADAVYATQANLKATSESISAEVTKAQGTADGAVTAASKAQQTADAVTLNLSKNYQTKAQNDAVYATKTSLKATSDSLTASISSTAKTAQSAVDKATNLEANLNGFKTTVSQTYTTKTDFNSLQIGGTNLCPKSNPYNIGLSNASKDSSGVINGTVPTNANATWGASVTPGYATHLKTPYGRQCVLSFDVWSEIAATVVVDVNNMPESRTAWNGNDNDGWRGGVQPTTTTTTTNGAVACSIPAKQWTRLWITYSNTSPKNTGKVDIFDQSHIGLRPASTAYQVKFKDFKFELGSRPTEYSPCPSDLQPAGDYSTKSELTQTSDAIKAQVSEVSKTASGAMSKATTVEQTANGLSTRITAQGKTLDATTKTANEAKSTADSNKQTISQVKTTADGAVSRVSAVEQNLDGFESTVAKTYQPKDGMSAYATTSALKQTSGSITAQVAEVSKTASGAMSKATTVEQTANGLSTRITEQAKTLDATVKTANEAKSTADSNKQTISQVKTTADGAVSRVSAVEQNLDGFESTVAKTYQPKDGMSAYATNSALTQKANEITGKVAEVAKTTQGNTTTISQVSQKADKINTTLSQKIDGKADVSRVSSLEQNLSGFKTTVAQSYQPKGDYPTRSDMQSSISQTASSIKTEVANTYTTQAATEALRKSATRTFTIGGAAGKAKWVKLGYLTSNGDSSSILLHVYSGNGYNGQASQNAEFEIFVKDGYQSTTSATGAFGVSVSRIRNADDVKVKVMAFSSTTCDIWAWLPWAYWNGHYTLQGDYHAWQDGPNCGGTRIQDAEPTSGTAQNLAYDTLSTRSYVDQTAKSVALGVVQSYKGSDGSGLATKSDITVAKTSITSSVSSTYATKTGVTQEISSKITQNNNSLDVKFSTKTETKNAQDTANTANSHASDAQSRIGSLEDCINMTSQGVRVGKRVNGKWSGWSALVNTGGSYDIFDSAGAKQATFSSGRLDLGKSSHNTNGIYVPAGGNWTSGWLCIDDYLVDCDHTRHIYACAHGGLLCFKGRVALTNPTASGDQRVIDGGKWYRAMQGKYSVYPYLDVDDDERDWPVTFKRSDNNLLAVGTLFIPRATRDIWWYDPTRGKHTMWIDLNNLQIPMGNNVIG